MTGEENCGYEIPNSLRSVISEARYFVFNFFRTIILSKFSTQKWYFFLWLDILKYVEVPTFQHLHAAGTASSAKAILILMIDSRELRRVDTRSIISNLIPVVFSTKKLI